MMDQTEHLTEDKQQSKFFTRSAARHLRRKRFNEARRAEKHWLSLLNGTENNTNENKLNAESSNAEVLTKSKARRLRKKNKAKLLETYNPLPCCYDPYTCAPIYNANSYKYTETSQYTPYYDRSGQSIPDIQLDDIHNLQQNVQALFSLGNKAHIDAFNSLEKEINPSKCRTTTEQKQRRKTERAVKTQVYETEPDENIEQSRTEPFQFKPSKDSSNVLNLLDSSILPKSEKTKQINAEELQETQLDSSELCKLPLNLLSASNLPSEKAIEGTNTSCTNFETKIQQTKLELPNDIVNQNLSNTNSCISSVDCDTDPGAKWSCLHTAPDATTLLTDKPNFIESGKNIHLTNLEDCNCSSHLSKDRKVFNEKETDRDINKDFSTNTLICNKESTSEFTKPAFNAELPIETNVYSEINELQKATINSKTDKLSSTDTVVEGFNTPLAQDNTDSKDIPNYNQPMATVSIQPVDHKMNTTGKTREEVKAEREAKKAAKAAAKAKSKTGKVQGDTNSNQKTAKLDKSIDKKEEQDTCKVPVIENNEENLNSCAKSGAVDTKCEGKSKAELRAERRAKQEAQRAAKQNLLVEKNKEKELPSETLSTTRVDETVKKTIKKAIVKENAHEVDLFKHLYHERELAFINVPAINSDIHPAIVRLGVQYANKVIVGSNARCIALLAAVKELIKDFEKPSQADFIRGLEATLQESAAYLHHCRPLAVSMQNALRHLKWQMTQLSSATADQDVKGKLSIAIDTYILEQIQLAGKAISITIQTKISNGDVILTYGYSSLIEKILLDAHTTGKQFRVVVVDGRPWLEGKEQLRRLAKHGIECSYVLINALSYIMPEVSKVFLGAHAILANGAVMSRVGTAQVALMARAFNVPVLVACETHKSCERVQTDSIVYNELGDADELTQSFLFTSKKSVLVNWRTKKSLNLLNIMYDVTPADLVTAVVTELAILPCTSVPVILRIKPSEI